MCGTVGYVGSKPVVKILLDGLSKLEYRGYDLRIIFDELAALRMMIADIEERMEPLPERLQAAAEAAEKIPSLASRDELAKLASDVRAVVKEKLSQLGESLDSASAEIEACRSSQKDSDKIVAELCSDVAILKDLLPESSDSLADEIFSLKSRLEEVEGAAAAFAEKSGPRDEPADGGRSEERRVGKECRSRWSPYH